MNTSTNNSTYNPCENQQGTMQQIVDSLTTEDRNKFNAMSYQDQQNWFQQNMAARQQFAGYFYNNLSQFQIASFKSNGYIVNRKGNGYIVKPPSNQHPVPRQQQPPQQFIEQKQQQQQHTAKTTEEWNNLVQRLREEKETQEAQYEEEFREFERMANEKVCQLEEYYVAQVQKKEAYVQQLQQALQQQQQISYQQRQMAPNIHPVPVQVIPQNNIAQSQRNNASIQCLRKVDFQEIKERGYPYSCPFCERLTFRAWNQWKQHWYNKHDMQYFAGRRNRN